MSYIRKKLSQEDLNILNDIYDKLQQIIIPTRYQKTSSQGQSRRTGACNQKNARQVCFGYTTYKGKKKLSLFTDRFAHIMELFKEFINSHYPEFEFDGVYVNKNVQCKKHIDSKNVGQSLLVGFGEYSGGESCLFLDKEYVFDIQNHSLIFNGSQIEHKSLPFTGNRYSLVFFKS